MEKKTRGIKEREKGEKVGKEEKAGRRGRKVVGDVGKWWGGSLGR